jgi:carbonic anhydrase
VRLDWLPSILLIMATAAVPSGALAQWKTPWDYAGPRGPDHWGALDPAYAPCSSGLAQSPIDIRATTTADLSPLRFDYRSNPLRGLTDNGKTIRVNYHAPHNDDFLVVGPDRYRLDQFHFHRPSEERVNGRQYDMSLHLMHETADGRVAGVAVLLTAGKANPTVEQLWDHMPKVVGTEDSIVGVEIAPGSLLPQDLGYYTYSGSLTAPPCTEGVTWFVLKTPVEISSSQIAAFARRYPHDVRQVQPLNGRVVRATP